MNSSVPEEGSSERLGSTVFVRSKSPEKESNCGMEGGPKVAKSDSFGVELEAGTEISEGAVVAPGSGDIGAKPDVNGGGMV